MATINDVCKAAGVSKATVSRVINDSEHVKEKTRESVLAAMESLGYRPNAYARALAMKSYNTFGLVLPDFESHYFGSLLTQAEKDIQGADKKLFVMSSHNSPEGEMEAIRSLKAQLCDAIIIYSRHLSEAQLVEIQEEIKTQLIVLNRSLSHEKLFSFGFDQQQIARTAVEYLLELGHKAIACITTPLASQTGQDRLNAYKSSLETQAIEIDERLIQEGKSTMESGYVATLDLINSGVAFSAIFACNDAMAIGAIRALYDNGLAVPGDVSVIGIDADPAVAYSIPRLSTVELPIIELTRDAVEVALTLNEEGLSKKMHNQYQGKLVVQESTAEI